MIQNIRELEWNIDIGKIVEEISNAFYVTYIYRSIL